MTMATTIVWFSSDNGGVNNVGDNGPLRGSKLTPYQGGIRVAAAIRWPVGQVTGGRTVNARMGYIDVVPTLMAMIGHSTPPDRPWDGVNVLAALQHNAPLPDRAWFTYLDQNPDRRERLALNHDGYKLVTQRDAPDALDATAPLVELFAIASDPNEKHNLAPTDPATVAELTAALENFLNLKSATQIPRFKAGADDFTPPTDWQVKD